MKRKLLSFVLSLVFGTLFAGFCDGGELIDAKTFFISEKLFDNTITETSFGKDNILQLYGKYEKTAFERGTEHIFACCRFETAQPSGLTGAPGWVTVTVSNETEVCSGTAVLFPIEIGEDRFAWEACFNCAALSNFSPGTYDVRFRTTLPNVSFGVAGYELQQTITIRKSSQTIAQALGCEDEERQGLVSFRNDATHPWCKASDGVVMSGRAHKGETSLLSMKAGIPFLVNFEGRSLDSDGMLSIYGNYGTPSQVKIFEIGQTPLNNLMLLGRGETADFIFSHRGDDADLEALHAGFLALALYPLVEVSFDANNGGLGDPKPILAAEGTAYAAVATGYPSMWTFPESGPERPPVAKDGKAPSFLGWYYGKERVTGKTILPKGRGNHTLIAHWDSQGEDEAGPDLIVSSISADPDVIEVWKSTRVRATVQNVGKGNALPCSVRLMIDGNQEGGERSVGKCLEPGEYWEVSWRLSGRELGVGTHTVVAVVDVYDDVKETNEGNNVSGAAQITVVSPPPSSSAVDWEYTIPAGLSNSLYLTTETNGTRMVSTFKVGDPIYVRAAFHNAEGGAVTTPISLRGVVKADEIPLYGDEESVLWQWPSLKAGGIAQIPDDEQDADILQGLKPGAYRLICTIDPDDRYQESDESDNVRSVSFVVVDGEMENKSCVVTFASDYDADAGAPITVTPGQRYAATGQFPSAGPTPPSASGGFCKFMGWVKESDYIDGASLGLMWYSDWPGFYDGGVWDDGGPCYDPLWVTGDSIVPDSASIRVWAIWDFVVGDEFGFGISYNMNGGVNDERNPFSYKVGDLPIQLAVPTKKGYEFAGWILGGKLVTQIPKGTVGDISIKAVWVQKDQEDDISAALGVPGLEWSVADYRRRNSTETYGLTVDTEWSWDGEGSVRTDARAFSDDGIAPCCGMDIDVTGPTTMRFRYSKSFSDGVFDVECGGRFLYQDDVPGIRTAWKQVTLDIPAGRQKVMFVVRPGSVGRNRNNDYNGVWLDDFQFGEFEHDPVYTIDYDLTIPKGGVRLNAGRCPESNPLTYSAADLPIDLEDAIPILVGYEFAGWILGGKLVTQIPKGAVGDLSLTASWKEPDSPVQPGPGSGSTLYPDGTDADFAGEAAATYDGYLLDAAGAVVGTINVKTAKVKEDRKTGAKTSAATATVCELGQKKRTMKGTLDLRTGKTDYKVWPAPELVIGRDGITGSYRYGHDCTVVGARNFFAAKPAEKGDVLAKFDGRTYTVALKTEDDGGNALANGYSTLSIAIGAKGKVKTTGVLADGTKVSVTGQLLVGANGVCCVPVLAQLYSGKSGGFGFLLKLDAADPASVEVGALSAWDGGSFKGIWSAAAVGVSGPLNGGSLFNLEDVWDGVNGAEPLEELLPRNESVITSGAKWIVAKAGKVKLEKSGALTYDAKANPSGLKLTYAAKMGLFTGSFSVYTLVNGKLKKASATVSGAVVDGVGYGTATIKKVGSVPVVINGIRVESANNMNISKNIRN